MIVDDSKAIISVENVDGVLTLSVLCFSNDVVIANLKMRLTPIEADKIAEALIRVSKEISP